MVKQNNSCLPAWIFSLLFIVSGCAALGTTGEESPPPPEPVNLAHPFTDVPVPKGFKLDRSRTFIYESGSGTVKVGRLFFSGGADLKETASFYENEMTNQGWKLVNSMEHKGKILHYEKEGWVCTVVILSGWMGSDVEIQIGPK